MVTEKLVINYALQIFKLVLVIIQITFFLSMLWANFCDYFYRYFGVEDDESFTIVNDIEPFKELTGMTIIVKVMYYSFTTMSTVGFGDMKPLNSFERILCAVAMICSVVLCSLIFSMFLEII